MATAPAMRNDSHTAAPATAPAAPSRAKIPAPTIEPTPMNAAWRTLRCLTSAGAATPSAGSDIAGAFLRDHVRSGLPGHDRGDLIQGADRGPFAGFPGEAHGRLDLRPHRAGRELMPGEFTDRDLAQLARLWSAPVEVDAVHVGGH